MTLESVTSPRFHSHQVVKRGPTAAGQPRYSYRHSDCPHPTFMGADGYRGSWPEAKEPISDRAMNGSGIRDSARGWRINPRSLFLST